MKNKHFEILMDERYWTIDDNNVLCSVVCLIDGQEVDMPVMWDEEGAYVSHDRIKEYVLVNTENEE